MEQKLDLIVDGYSGFSIELLGAEYDDADMLNVTFLLHHNNDSLYGWGCCNDANWEIQFELEELEDNSGNIFMAERFMNFTQHIGIHPFPVVESVIHLLEKICFLVSSNGICEGDSPTSYIYQNTTYVLLKPLASQQTPLSALNQ